MCKVMEEYGAIREKRTSIEIAKGMIVDGVNFESISKWVKLTLEEVQALYDELVAEGKIQAKPNKC